MGDQHQHTSSRDDLVLEENTFNSCVERPHSLVEIEGKNNQGKTIEKGQIQMKSPYVPDSTHISPFHGSATNNM